MRTPLVEKLVRAYFSQVKTIKNLSPSSQETSLNMYLLLVDTSPPLTSNEVQYGIDYMKGLK